MGKGILPPAANPPCPALRAVAASCTALLVIFASLVSCSRLAEPTRPRSGEVAPASTDSVPAPRIEEPVRAAYFYGYMSLSHLDSLVAAGFNRALIKSIGDSLGRRGAAQMRAWMEGGRRAGIEIVPTWSLQSRTRLASLSTARRYTWGEGFVEPEVGCPLDPLFWRSALRDRAAELLAVVPARRLVLDLEIYTGTRHHYDAGPCRCPGCLRDYRAQLSTTPATEAAPSLAVFEESRLTRLLADLLSELATAHLGVELGIFDLDLDSFVHRAMARALDRAGVPAVDYTERTYSRAGNAVPEVRNALEAIGVRVPIVGGVKLGRFLPKLLPGAIESVVDRTDGYFAFTTFSLWVEPEHRTGAYALLGTPERYWAALRHANR